MSLEDRLSAKLDDLEPALVAPAPFHRRKWEYVIRLQAWRAAEFRHAVDRLEDMPAAAMVIVRALADLTILTLWIETCPKLHTVLWAAEGDRTGGIGSDALVALAELRGRPLPESEYDPPEARARIERSVERYRRIALQAGVPISSKPGKSVLPDVRKRTQHLDLAELEMYDVAFGVTSGWAHSAAYTMPIATAFDEQGVWIAPTHLLSRPIPRRFAIALQAGQFAAVSRIAGLGIEGALDLIRAEAVQAAGE